MATKKIRGLFVNYKDQYYGPVDTKEKANELCVYLLNKNQKLVIKGLDGLLEVVGNPPVVCKGNIRIDEQASKVIKQEFRPLYEFNMKMNPDAVNKKLMDDFIKQQEVLNEQSSKGTSDS